MSDSYVNFGSSALPGEPQTVGQAADGQGTGERRGRGATILLPGNAPNATALKPGDIIPGTVASLGADGRLRVDTAHGPVFLDRSTGLKTGAQIQLQVVATGAQPELKLLAQAPESPLPPPRAEAPALRPGADLVVRLAPQQDVPGRATGHGQLSHALGALIDKLGGALRNAPPTGPTLPEPAAPAALSKGPAAAGGTAQGAERDVPRGADAIRREPERGPQVARTTERDVPRGADAIRREPERGPQVARTAEREVPRGADAIRREPERGPQVARTTERDVPRGADAIRREPERGPQVARTADREVPRGADAIRREPERGPQVARSAEREIPRGADAIRRDPERAPPLARGGAERDVPRGADAIRRAPERGPPVARGGAEREAPRGADAIRRPPEQSQPRGADAIRRPPDQSQPRGADAIRRPPEQSQPRGADAIRRDPDRAPPRGADAIRAERPATPAPRPVPAAPPARAPTPAPAQPAPQAATTTAPPAQTTQAPTTPQEGRLLNPLQVPAGSGGPAADVVRHGAAAYRSVALPAGGLLTAGLGATLGAGSPGAGLVPGAPTPAAGSSAAGPAAPGGSPPGAPTGSTAGATGAAPTTATTAGGPAAPNAAATTANPAGAAPSTASSGAASTGAPPAPAAPGATASTATPAAGPPSSLPGAAPSAAGAATTASQPAATGAPTGDAAGGPPAPAPAPMSLHVRVLALHPPGQAMSLPGSHGDVLVGTVTGSGNGQVTIATDAGVLTVRTAPPPVGTRVVMQVIAEPGTVMPTTPADQRAQVIQSLSHGWPSLEAAVQALKQINPQMAAQTVQNALPQPGPLLSAGIALFLNALTGGNIGEWLGRSPLAALERGGRGDVARKLTDDFSQMSRLAADPATGDWRVVLLPVYAHDRVHQLRLYMRRHGGNDADDDASGTRFVVEAELSRLGPLQLDGLWRQQRFDLIVRTREALPPEVERGIQDIFLQAGAEANFAGGLGFQVADPFPVAPLDEEDGHAVGVFA